MPQDKTTKTLIEAARDARSRRAQFPFGVKNFTALVRIALERSRETIASMRSECIEWDVDVQDANPENTLSIINAVLTDEGIATLESLASHAESQQPTREELAEALRGMLSVAEVHVLEFGNRDEVAFSVASKARALLARMQ